RRNDSAVDRHQVRRELNRDPLARCQRKFLLDLGEMSMFWNAVGTRALVALDKQVIGFDLAAGAADAAQGIGDNAGGLDQAVPEQRNNRKQDTGWITPG